LQRITSEPNTASTSLTRVPSKGQKPGEQRRGRSARLVGKKVLSKNMVQSCNAQKLALVELRPRSRQECWGPEIGPKEPCSEGSQGRQIRRGESFPHCSLLLHTEQDLLALPNKRRRRVRSERDSGSPSFPGGKKRIMTSSRA